MMSPKQMEIESKHMSGTSALFDRTGWKTVRFSDVVERNVGKVNRDLLEGTERWVAGDHIDEGDLHIRRESLTDDPLFPPTFRYTFDKGNVLLHSRNPKKVAQPHFNGITGEKLFVLRPKDERSLLNELLPFVLLSEHFQRWAIENSSGSVNKFLNWSALERYEFALPPLDQQRRIAELLWAVDEVVTADLNRYEALSELKKAALTEWTMHGKGKSVKAPKLMLLDDLVELSQYGLSLPLNDTGTHPVLRMMNYDEELVAPNELKYIDATPDLVSNYTVKKNDLLFNRTNSWELVGQVGIFQLEGEYLFASYLVRLRVKKGLIIPEFLNYYMNSPEGQAKIRSYASRAIGQSNISASNLLKMDIPVPPLKVQEEVVDELNSLSSLKRQARAHQDIQAALLRQLINASLG